MLELPFQHSLFHLQHLVRTVLISACSVITKISLILLSPLPGPVQLPQGLMLWLPAEHTALNGILQFSLSKLLGTIL